MLSKRSLIIPVLELQKGILFSTLNMASRANCKWINARLLDFRNILCLRLCVCCVWAETEPAPPHIKWWYRPGMKTIAHIHTFSSLWWVCAREDGSENVTLNCHTVATHTHTCVHAHTHTPNETERGFRCANPGAEEGETLPFLHPPVQHTHTHKHPVRPPWAWQA